MPVSDETCVCACSAAGEGGDAGAVAQPRRQGVRTGDGRRARAARDRHGDGACRARQAAASRRAEDKGDEQGEEAGEEHPRPAHGDGAILPRLAGPGQRGDIVQQVISVVCVYSSSSSCSSS